MVVLNPFNSIMKLTNCLATCFLVAVTTLMVQAQTPRNYALHKMDSSINNEFEEIQPIVTRDGQTMYFVRSLSPRNEGGKESGQDILDDQKDR